MLAPLVSRPLAMRTMAANPVIAGAGNSMAPPQAGTPIGSEQLSAPSKLVIEFDQASQRFVQTLLDDAAHEILRRYPDEAQLAFSRGVNAYVRAMRHDRV